MNKVITGCFLVAILAVPTFAATADNTASATLTVTGTLASSITLTVDSAGGTFTPSGVNGSTALGTFSKYGAQPTGFLRDNTSSTTFWTLSSNVGITVTKANSTSTGYSLTAMLGSPVTTGVDWKFGSANLIASVLPVTTIGGYGTSTDYPWVLTISNTTAVEGSINNSIVLVATANYAIRRITGAEGAKTLLRHLL